MALFLLSLALPGVTVPGKESVFGFELLLVGWIGIGSYDFPWYANILYFCSLANMRSGRYTIAYRLSLLSIPIALLSFTANTDPFI